MTFALRAMLAMGFTSLAVATAAQAQDRAAREIRYRITELGTPGVSSRAASINDFAWAAGNAVRPDGQYRHATLWLSRRAIDLGALGGPDANSSVAWDGLNNRGAVVGISQTARPEPLGEAWSCSAFFTGAAPTGKTCLGFVWRLGVMRPLPPYAGGHNSYATGVNWSGRIVGWAENGIHDPTCVAPQVLQFRATIWDRRPGGPALTELPPLAGDQTSAATSINSSGDVVGISGACDVAVGRHSAKHSVLWRNGRPREIPNLGGASWNTPTAINDRREVVGFANVPGEADMRGELDERAFYWSAEAGLLPIGALPGDQTSEALGINTRGQVVGVSSGPNGTRAFLWRRGGGSVDLNTLVAHRYPGTLIDARDIDDQGVITGAALDATGKRVAFIARPVLALAGD